MPKYVMSSCVREVPGTTDRSQCAPLGEVPPCGFSEREEPRSFQARVCHLGQYNPVAFPSTSGRDARRHLTPRPLCDRGVPSAPGESKWLGIPRVRRSGWLVQALGRLHVVPLAVGWPEQYSARHTTCSDPSAKKGNTRVHLQHCAHVENTCTTATTPTGARCSLLPSSLLLCSLLTSSLLRCSLYPSSLLRCSLYPSSLLRCSLLPSSLLRCSLPSSLLPPSFLPSSLLPPSSLLRCSLPSSLLPSSLLRCFPPPFFAAPSFPPPFFAAPSFPPPFFAAPSFLPPFFLPSLLRCSLLPSSLLRCSILPSSLLRCSLLPSSLLRCSLLPSSLLPPPFLPSFLPPPSFLPCSLLPPSLVPPSSLLGCSLLLLGCPNVTPQHVHARWDRGTWSQGCAQLSCSKRVRSAFCPSPHLLSATLTVMSRGLSRVSFSASSSPSLPSVGRDVGGVFARVLASLPTPLVLALRESELDVATTLRDYTRMDALELQGLMKEEWYCREQDSTSLVAPSGATSSSHSTLSYGHFLLEQPDEWKRTRGGDPRTVHAISVTGGDPKTVHATFGTGGDPKTDHEAFVRTGGDPKTDHANSMTGGDPKTDFAIYCAGAFSLDSGSSPREGGVWHPKLPQLFSWTCLILLRQSALNFVMDSVRVVSGIPNCHNCSLGPA